MKTNYDFLPHELEHLSFLKDNAHECALFLKRDDDSFPLKEPTEIVLIGSGVRHTYIGGTGSGAVNVRYKETIEESFINAGFKISSTDWLNSYDKIKAQNEKDYVKHVKKQAKEFNANAVVSFSVGKFAPECDYEFPIIGNHETAIYVLARNAGEGSDRPLVKGSVYLTDTEIRDILYLNNHYKNFLLVLNVAGVVDLSPVMEVRNILLISQLGSMIGDILVNIVLGKVNPSGKLTDTWAKVSDYPYITKPLELNECRYEEGIYVGYRYFDSKRIEPLFPFGFGLSYTKFDYQFIEVNNNKDNIVVKVKVTNKGNYPGKEVVQLYMSGPVIRPENELVAFNKTKLLAPKESEIIGLEFKLSEFPTYNEAKEAYLIDAGDYVFRLGNSSRDLKDAFAISIKEDIIVKQVRNVFNKTDFEDLFIDRPVAKISKNLPVIELNSSDFESVKVTYKDKHEVEAPNFVKGLTDDELIYLVLGDYKTGIDGLIGQSCSQVLGGAGETTLRVESINRSLNMVDGPAGLRIIQEYIVNHKGTYEVTEDSIWHGIKNYLPKAITYLLSYERNLKKKGSRILQIATAIPVATAIAQSFNRDFARDCGRLVKDEMEMYDVDIWLAPGVNIHRHILCGRNFEYYSEDTLVSSVMASSIINAVQSNPHKATTIKHYACNNQETNRTNNNSIVSERAAREIYFRVFEKAIKWSNPFAIMASYNLINGIHASEHKGMLIDILRDEWGYQGLIMTDWIASGQAYHKGNKYPCAYASRNIKNGTNICMPGNKADIKDIKAALKSGYLTRNDLEVAATIVYNSIQKMSE